MQKRDLRALGVKTHFWEDSSQAGGAIVFVHGLSGDHHGLMPLAYCLRRSGRVLLLELPGHGESAIPGWTQLDDFQLWFAAALDELRKRYGRVSVIAHSFGCSVVAAATSLEDLILINPVPSPVPGFAGYARVMYRLRWLVSPVYNFYPLAMLRGLAIRKVRGRTSLAILHWITIHTRITPKQFRYQILATENLLKTKPFEAMRQSGASRLLVLAGIDDNIPKQRDSLQLQQVFPSAAVLLLRGGHILPLESPAYAAQAIVWAQSEFKSS